MKWSDIGKDIAKAAPLIGSILGGPAGAAAGAVGSIVASVLGVDNTPAAVAQELKKNPDALAKVRKAELAHQDKLAELQVTAAQNRLAADTQRIQSVNKTMQAETKAEHWAQWLWRPLNGLLFAPTILALYVILPAIQIHVPNVPVTVWEAWGALLGITAWHRGVKQRLQAGDGPSLGARIGQAISTMGKTSNAS
jgi:hypothetical protein